MEHTHIYIYIQWIGWTSTGNQGFCWNIGVSCGFSLPVQGWTWWNRTAMGGSGWGGWDGDHFGTMIYWKCAVGVEDIFRSVDITGEMESPRGYKGYKTNKTGRGGSKWCLQPGSGLQSWVAMIRYLDFAPGWFKFSELVDFALGSKSSKFAGVAVLSLCVYSSSIFFSLEPQHCVVGYTAAMLDSNQRCVRRTTYDMTIGLSGLMNHNRIRFWEKRGKKTRLNIFQFCAGEIIL